MSDHDWLDYDETHKACLRCGLRLFWSKGTAYGQRGWVLVDFNGVTSPNLLGTGSGKFGRCTPPERTPVVETVLIDYTGDPEIHPSCERYMHRLPPAPKDALLDVKTLVPVCGYRAEWWELGPSRDHVGWSWCLDCWGRGKPRAVDLPPAPPTVNQGPTLAEWKAGRLIDRAGDATGAGSKQPKKRSYCYCPRCAGGLPPRSETIRDIKAIRGRKFK